MRLDGRRESSNVEDRRGMSGGAKAGIGGCTGADDDRSDRDCR